MPASKQRYIFVADIHLEPGGGPRTERFAVFLNEFCHPGDEVYVLGDLFDLWLGRGHERRADYASALVTMTQATSRGIALNILPGNRDFLMGAEIELTCGASVLSEEVELTVAGERLFVCHGDQFCTSDRRYQRLRAMLHSWPLRMAARILPIWVRRKVAKPIRRRALADTEAKSDELMGFVDAELERRIDRGIDTIICGHAHRKQERQIGAGRLFVLGCWEETREALVYEGDMCRWITVC